MRAAAAEYAPDRAKIDPKTSDSIKNVIPNADGWGPFPELQAYSGALSGVCKGAILARNSDGSYSVAAGTATTLEILSGTTWQNKSGTSAPYTLSDSDFWSFTQARNQIFAANINDPVQEFTLGSSSVFADLGGSPPQAAHVWTESGYLALGRHQNAETRIQRSGLLDFDHWTLGEKGCTRQDLVDGGWVMGAAGDSRGAFIFSQGKVRRLINQPGMEIGFTLEEVESSRGAISAYGIVSVGSMIFFLCEDGFYRLGSPSSPIGAQRIDKTFLDDVELEDLPLVQGVADPVRKMVWWRYRSTSNSSTDYTDKLLGYHWQLDRWCYAEVNLEYMLPAASPGYTLEELDTVLGYTSLETIPYSLDSRVWKGGRPAFSGFDTAHKLGFFEGDPLEALLDSADIPMGGEGRTAFVRGWRPMGDVTGAYGQVGVSSTMGGSKTWGAETAQNATGLIPCRASGRTHRYRLRIPSGTAWNHFVGIETEGRTAGRR